MTSEQLGETLPILLSIAWLLPLLGFVVELVVGANSPRTSKTAAYIAVGAIGTGFACSLAALILWGAGSEWAGFIPRDHGHHGEHHVEGGHHTDENPTGEDGVDGKLVEKDEYEEHDHPEGEDGHHDGEGEHDEEHASAPVFSGTFYRLAKFGAIEISLDYHIDGLTLLMFTMVTLIATCIHIFAIGYMSDELTEDHVDHEVHLPDGSHLHRPGRFHRFFAYLSLFCFSMLGLVIAGNIFQVFVFWELVGVCSYLLIGFYTERKSASTAANKAFIMNRVGDFGFLIGLMILITSLGTFRFFDHQVDGNAVPGLFTMIRGDDGELVVDDKENPELVYLRNAEGELAETSADGAEVTQPTISYFLLIAAGLGIFAGCVGKSAQFPLHTWLPDAMEGPTPVSALVHSATMVAAGVYLAGRFYPVFTPEVLTVIAYIGCITLFVGATIAVVATDIKKVLAYSTISQLGYMMLALGVGGWGAGLFHLITHAFFKSLMFLCSGSVIHACHHVQEMPRMGGLLRKMPITAITMLIGVIAISGLAIPGTSLAFSGYYSKDAIVASALAHSKLNAVHYLLFIVPLITAGITAFYMFRMWFYTFLGTPRDQHVYDHAHESPTVMTAPLIVLAVFAAFCAWGGESGVLYSLLDNAGPEWLSLGVTSDGPMAVVLPDVNAVHDVHSRAGFLALTAAIIGTSLAYVIYGLGLINPSEIVKQSRTVHRYLVDKWRFDELYDAMFVRPVHAVGAWVSGADRRILDGILHGASSTVVGLSRIGRRFDESVIDGLVNLVGRGVRSVAYSLKGLQTGQLRQYVMFIAVGVVGLFLLLFTFLPTT